MIGIILTYDWPGVIQAMFLTSAPVWSSGLSPGMLSRSARSGQSSTTTETSPSNFYQVKIINSKKLIVMKAESCKMILFRS